MFKYGGQVERISQKSYYTVLQQKTKKHSCCDDHHFCFHLFILFVCDSKTKKKEKYTYQNVCTKLLCSICITLKSMNTQLILVGFFLGVTSTWVIVQFSDVL